MTATKTKALPVLKLAKSGGCPCGCCGLCCGGAAAAQKNKKVRAAR